MIQRGYRKSILGMGPPRLACAGVSNCANRFETHVPNRKGNPLLRLGARGEVAFRLAALDDVPQVVARPLECVMQVVDALGFA